MPIDTSNPFIYLIALAIWILVLYFVINQATRTDKLLHEQRKQTALLAKMAKNAGVAMNELQEIMGNQPF